MRQGCGGFGKVGSANEIVLIMQKDRNHIDRLKTEAHSRVGKIGAAKPQTLLSLV